MSPRERILLTPARPQVGCRPSPQARRPSSRSVIRARFRGASRVPREYRFIRMSVVPGECCVDSRRRNSPIPPLPRLRGTPFQGNDLRIQIRTVRAYFFDSGRFGQN